jgi:hypothetical protein
MKYYWGPKKRHFVNHSKTFLVSHSFSDEEHKQEVNNSIHKGSHFSNRIKFFITLFLTMIMIIPINITSGHRTRKQNEKF